MPTCCRGRCASRRRQKRCAPTCARTSHRRPDRQAVDGLALALVLGAASFHAGWNVALRDAGDRVAAVTLACLFDALLLAPGLVLSPPRGVMPLVPISAVAEAVYVLALGAAYGRGQLSLAYPIGRGT